MFKFWLKVVTKPIVWSMYGLRAIMNIGELRIPVPVSITDVFQIFFFPRIIINAFHEYFMIRLKLHKL